MEDVRPGKAALIELMLPMIDSRFDGIEVTGIGLLASGEMDLGMSPLGDIAAWAVLPQLNVALNDFGFRAEPRGAYAGNPHHQRFRLIAL